MARTLLTAFLLVCVGAADASAQQVQRPSRPYRGLFGGGPPPDPNRTRSELTFTGSILGGYDTWVSPGGGGIDPAQAQQSGRTFTGEATLAYFYGRAQRSLSIEGRAMSLGYSGIGVDPTLGGGVTVLGNTPLGRVTQLRAMQTVTYDPSMVLGIPQPTGAEAGALIVPSPDVTSGYLEQRSWSSTSNLTFDRRWTPRHMMQLGADYARSTFLDEFGYDTTSIGASASHAWQFRRTSSLRGVYHIVDTTSTGALGLDTPSTNQRIEAAFTHSRRLSPTRSLSFSVGGGATHVNTLSTEDRAELVYWTPSGSSGFSLDLGRSWSVAANYTRAVNVLQGVSLTSFASDAAHVSVSGLVNSRIEAALSATYANGRAGGTNTTGTYENYSGSLQLRYAISRCCATSMYYDYYVYSFQNVSDLPSGFLSSFDRQAVRFGFTLWLPLYGSYADGRGRGAVRGN